MLLKRRLRHFNRLRREISVDLLGICIAILALAGAILLGTSNAWARSLICIESQAGAVERSTFAAVQELVDRDASERQIQKRIEALNLPTFLKYVLIEGLTQARKNSEPINLKLGLQDVLFHLGQRFMDRHPEIQNDIDLLQEIRDSSLTSSYKWFLIDGVLAHNEIKAWPRGPILSPSEQLKFFETQVNSGSRNRTSLEVPFPVKERLKNSLTVETAGKVPEFVRSKFFMPDGRVLIPVHPVAFDGRTTTNQNLALGTQSIPFYSEATVLYWKARLTASRSTMFDWISIKMPAQFPNPTWTPENNKIPVIEDVRESLPRTRLIDEIDQRLGKEKRLILLKDILAITDHESGNALLVRDTSPLQDGSHYMPAFSTREAGKVISDKLRAEFDHYWMRHYAYSWGRSKALLLLRYGLMLESSHDQQWLLQMKHDQNNGILVPTDVNVIRDLGDTFFVGPIAETIAPEWFQKEYQHRRIMNDFTDLNIASLTDGHYLDNSWSLAHQQGIRETIEMELGIKLPEKWHSGQYLSSDEFQMALRRYHRLPEPR